MPTPKNWDYFEEDAELKEANLRIVDVTWKAGTQATTFYMVEFLCCGEMREMSHKTIARRLTRKSERCDACMRRYAGSTLHSKREPQTKFTWLHGVWCPSARAWPVPKSIYGGK